MPNEIVKPQQHEGGLPMLSSGETRELIRAAIDKGGVEAIERVCALYERAQEKQAARAYHDALARFSASMKPIAKTKHVGKPNRDGTGFHYAYAPLENIALVIAEPLRAVGLSYSWDSELIDKMMKVTCKVHHIDGHFETASFTCPIGANGAISAAQNTAASLTFGRRQTLVQALGLTTCDQDFDGADPGVGEPITDGQAMDIDTAIKDSKADKARFLKWLGVDKIENIPAARYVEAMQALEQKARGK